ncbi:MAG: hypothetical protein ABH875_06240, partial [Candidatus Omnitrophota bacterium]
MRRDEQTLIDAMDQEQRGVEGVISSQKDLSDMKAKKATAENIEFPRALNNITKAEDDKKAKRTKGLAYKANHRIHLFKDYTVTDQHGLRRIKSLQLSDGVRFDQVYYEQQLGIAAEAISMLIGEGESETVKLFPESRGSELWGGAVKISAAEPADDGNITVTASFKGWSQKIVVPAQGESVFTISGLRIKRLSPTEIEVTRPYREATDMYRGLEAFLKFTGLIESGMKDEDAMRIVEGSVRGEVMDVRAVVNKYKAYQKDPQFKRYLDMLMGKQNIQERLVDVNAQLEQKKKEYEKTSWVEIRTRNRLESDIKKLTAERELLKTGLDIKFRAFARMEKWVLDLKAESEKIGKKNGLGSVEYRKAVSEYKKARAYLDLIKLTEQSDSDFEKLKNPDTSQSEKARLTAESLKYLKTAMDSLLALGGIEPDLSMQVNLDSGTEEDRIMALNRYIDAYLPGIKSALSRLDAIIASPEHQSVLKRIVELDVQIAKTQKEYEETSGWRPFKKSELKDSIDAMQKEKTDLVAKTAVVELNRQNLLIVQDQLSSTRDALSEQLVLIQRAAKAVQGALEVRNRVQGGIDKAREEVNNHASTVQRAISRLEQEITPFIESAWPTFERNTLMLSQQNPALAVKSLDRVLDQEKGLIAARIAERERIIYEGEYRGRRISDMENELARLRAEYGKEPDIYKKYLLERKVNQLSDEIDKKKVEHQSASVSDQQAVERLNALINISGSRIGRVAALRDVIAGGKTDLNPSGLIEDMKKQRARGLSEDMAESDKKTATIDREIVRSEKDLRSAEASVPPGEAITDIQDILYSATDETLMKEIENFRSNVRVMHSRVDRILTHYRNLDRMLSKATAAAKGKEKATGYSFRSVISRLEQLKIRLDKAMDMDTNIPAEDVRREVSGILGEIIQLTDELRLDPWGIRLDSALSAIISDSKRLLFGIGYYSVSDEQRMKDEAKDVGLAARQAKFIVDNSYWPGTAAEGIGSMFRALDQKPISAQAKQVVALRKRVAALKE